MDVRATWAAGVDSERVEVKSYDESQLSGREATKQPVDMDMKLQSIIARLLFTALSAKAIMR